MQQKKNKVIKQKKRMKNEREQNLCCRVGSSGAGAFFGIATIWLFGWFCLWSIFLQGP